MIVAEWEIQPGEKRQYSHDFSSKMLEGEVIMTVRVKAESVADGTDATSEVIITGSVSFSGQVVEYGVTGENSMRGDEYVIALRATTDRQIGPTDNEVVEDEHMLIIT